MEGKQLMGLEGYMRLRYESTIESKRKQEMCQIVAGTSKPRGLTSGGNYSRGVVGFLHQSRACKIALCPWFLPRHLMRKHHTSCIASTIPGRTLGRRLARHPRLPITHLCSTCGAKFDPIELYSRKVGNG